MKTYKLINNVLGWLVFVVASAVYLMTIEPTASFWDCGEFISSSYKLEVGHPPGAPFFMNKFHWGGVDKPGIYIDENVMRMCKSYRMMLFNKLAETLYNQGQRDKALKVLDRCMQVLPPENVPLDQTALATGELYYALGKKIKGDRIYSAIAKDACTNIEWFFRLDGKSLQTVSDDLYTNLAVLQQVLVVAKKYSPEVIKKYEERFDNYRIAYQSITGDHK